MSIEVCFLFADFCYSIGHEIVYLPDCFAFVLVVVAAAVDANVVFVVVAVAAVVIVVAAVVVFVAADGE